MPADRPRSYADTMGEHPQDEQIALVALLQTRPEDLRWPEIAAEVLEVGSALEVWHRLASATLMAPPGKPDALESAAEDINRWADQGSRLVTILDSDYPIRLRGIHQAPAILFARGALIADDSAMSVVGSRKASDRGLAIAADVAHGLVSRGVTVAAGLAVGIDTAAHRAALADGGRTVAVIGTGINKAYPAENRDLQDEIATRGLLLSQFWPDAPPQKHTFLKRNATMSGYGLTTVIIEAGEMSGARAQARMAVEHGRQVILTSWVARNQWAQRLVGRPGVHVAGSVDDVVHIVEQVVAMWDDLRRLVTP
jgi:DNA processing protein